MDTNTPHSNGEDSSSYNEYVDNVYVLVLDYRNPPSPNSATSTAPLPPLEDHVRLDCACEQPLQTNTTFIDAVEERLLPNTSFSRVIDSGYRNSTIDRK